MRSDVFAEEIWEIYDGNLRTLAKDLLEGLPDYFYTVPASSPTNVTVWFSPLGKKKNRITKIEYIRTARIVSPNFIPSEIQFFMSLKNFFISTVS